MTLKKMRWATIFLLLVMPNLDISLAKGLSSPEVTVIGFPLSIPANGSPVKGWVGFRDAEGDLSRAEFDVIEGQDLTSFSIDLATDDKIKGQRQGAFDFSVTAKVPQRLTLEVTLLDEAGNRSEPIRFSFQAVWEFEVSLKTGKSTSVAIPAWIMQRVFSPAVKFVEAQNIFSNELQRGNDSLAASGFQLDPNTGTISGTPLQTGLFNLLINVLTPDGTVKAEIWVVMGVWVTTKSGPLKLGEFSVLLNPLTQGKTAQFMAIGEGITSIQVEIFNLYGHRIFSAKASGNTLIWDFENAGGQLLADGVYLYFGIARGTNGQAIHSKIKKLVILR